MQKWKFAHRKMLDVLGRGKLRVVCSCGTQSPIFRDNEDQTRYEQADDWWDNHTGLREVKPKEME